MNAYFSSILVAVSCLIALSGQSQSTYPYLKTPIADAVIDTREASVVFSWNQTQEGNYVLEIATEASFANATTYPSPINQLTIDRIELPENGFWRVRSGNSVTGARTFEQLDLSALDNLVYHIDASTGVDVDNEKVIKWQNQAQNNFVAIQPVLVNRPILSVDNINKKDVISFGGNTGSSIQYLTLENTFNIQNDFTVFALYKQKGFNTGLSYLLGNGNPISGIFTGGLSVPNFGITSPTEFYRISGSTSFNWELRTLYNNKISLNSTNQNIITVGSTNIPLIFQSIGSRPDLTNLNFFGDLAEIIIFDKNLTTSEANLLERYYYTKYIPFPELGNDTTTCEVSATISIDSDPIYTSIKWSNGENDKDSIIVNSNGWYWVETTALGITLRDSIFVSGLVPKPILSETGNTTICLGDTYNLTALNPPVGINYLWSDNSTNPALPITEAGTYTLTYLDNSGCAVESEELVVSINDFPATEGLGPDRTICRNTNIYFEDMGNGIAPYTYAWQGGGNAPFKTVTATGNQTLQVSVTDAMGCVAEDEVTFTVNSTLAPSISFEYDTVCPLSPTNYRDTSTPTSGDPITNHNWEVEGADLQGVSVNYTPISEKEYPVHYTVTSQSGCINTLVDTIRLLPQPEVEYQYTGSCAQSDFQFIAGQLTPEQIVDWQWYFEAPSTVDSTTGNGPVVLYNFDNAGMFEVSLVGTDSNGCRDSITQFVEVAPVPAVDFTAVEACVGDVVQFTNATVLPSPYTIQSQLWQFGEGTTSGQSNPAKPYFMAGEYNVTLTVTSSNGCVGSTNKTVKVHALPKADFYTDADCAGGATWFSDSSFVTNGSVAEVFWDFGDENEGSGFNVYHAYEEEGTYTVKQTVRSSFGCENTYEETITLDDYLKIDFTLDPFALLADYPTDFVNLSEGATNYSWTFGDFFESDATSPEFVFDTEAIGDTVLINLSGENETGCIDSKSLSFVVRRKQTDLAINQLFIQEENGFYIVGAELENKGTTPVTVVDLFLRAQSTTVVKEVWTGLLEAGEKEIHVFTAQIPITQDQSAQPEEYVCVEGQLISEFGFIDEEFANNELCKDFSDESPILLLPYPNPTQGKVTIRVILPTSAEASLGVFDALGNKVVELANKEELPKGLSRFEVDLTNKAQGTYTVFLKVGKERKSFSFVKL